MIEALKVITELLQGATDSALYAFVFYGIYKLLLTAMYVFPIIGVVKFLITRMYPTNRGLYAVTSETDTASKTS